LINLGVLNFISNVTVNTVNQSDGCFLTISVILQGQFVISSTMASVLFHLSHMNPQFTQQLNESVFIEGSLLTTNLGSSTLHGGIIEAKLVDAMTGEFRIRVGSALNASNIGLSIIQVSKDMSFATPVGRFFGGSESGAFEYLAQLKANVTVLNNTSVLVQSSGTVGYNPYKAFDNLLTSLSCFETFVCNASLQYEASPASIISAPDCRASRVCKNYEYQTVAPTYTTNRVCQNLTTCFDGKQLQLWNTIQSHSDVLAPTLQFESAAATFTSDRNCTNVTICAIGQIATMSETATSDRICTGGAYLFLNLTFFYFIYSCYLLWIKYRLFLVYLFLFKNVCILPLLPLKIMVT